MMRDKIVEIMYWLYEIVTDLWIGETPRAKAQVAEAKEIDNRRRGEYHEPYSVSRLRSISPLQEPGLPEGSEFTIL
jgi:hypothetical protein